MTKSRNARRKRLAARLGAEANPKVPLPDVICLPNQSQPLLPDAATMAIEKQPRHLGGRRVENPRSAWLSVRCTPDFRAAVEAAADRAGMKFADYVHAQLGDTSRVRQRRAGGDADLMRQVLGQMGRWGSNLNQIAYRLNACDFRDVASEMLVMRTDHEATLAAVREVVDEIKKFLGV